MSGLDIKCYRINYSREWLNGRHDTKLFPVDGAIDAIHALCDALEKKEMLLGLYREYFASAEGLFETHNIGGTENKAKKIAKMEAEQ